MASLRHVVMLVLGLLAFSALAVNEVNEEPYTVSTEPLEWIGILDPAQGNVSVFGYTIEEIEEHAKALSPKYSIFESPAAVVTAVAGRAAPAVLRRQSHDIHCNQPFDPVYTWRATRAWEYLRGVGGSFRLPAGPRKCSRVRCHQGAAIFACNDRTEEQTVWAANIADRADHIIKQCGNVNHENNADLAQTSGQNFNNDEGWNVAIGMDQSC